MNFMSFILNLSILVFLEILSGSKALAAVGAGSSGGALLLKDSANPWWVQNTKDVRYCIAIDENTFHLPRAQAERRIREAIDFWKNEFATTPVISQGEFSGALKDIRVATQNFVQVASCDGQEDLKIQLGFLNPDQQQSLPDMNSIIGFAVRTSYDTVNLRGKGYIYISPDHLAKKSPRLWLVGDGILFRHAMAHELGHVFGLIDSGDSVSLMSEVGMDELAALPEAGLEFYAQFVNEMGLGGIFETKREVNPIAWMACEKDGTLESSGSSAALEQVLGLSKEENPYCYELELDGNAFKIFSPRNRGARQLIGEATMKLASERAAATLVSMWLPDEQTVYELSPWASRKRFSVAEVTEKRLKGTFRVVATGRESEIAFVAAPGAAWPPQIMTVLDGRLYVDLFEGE